MRKKKQGLINCIIAVSIITGLCGCKGDEGSSEPQKEVISNSGSDTIVNLAQTWAEEYKKVAPKRISRGRWRRLWSRNSRSYAGNREYS